MSASKSSARLSHPSHILVCPRCGTLVTSKGEDGNYCGLHFPERVEPIVLPIVPRSEAEALAEALGRIALRSDGDVAHHDHAQRLARKRVDEYRSRHPKEMQ
jgi:hypothetical protein